MTPTQKLELTIAINTAKYVDISESDIDTMIVQEGEINFIYYIQEEYHSEWESFKDEIRHGTYNLHDFPSPYSRHLECKQVAAKMYDGSFVAWNYWYGGGKHTEPEYAEWIDSAYDVEFDWVDVPTRVWRKV
jgi:hypothetical protein